MRKPIIEPDYDFQMELIDSDTASIKIRFSTDTLFCKCEEGSITLLINYSEQVVTAGMHFMVEGGVIVKVLNCSLDLKLTLMRFSFSFFNGIYPMLSGEIIDVIAQTTPDLYEPKGIEMLDMTFRQLFYLHHEKHHTNRHILISNLVVNYLLIIYEQTYHSITKSHAASSKDRAIELVCRFYELCNDDAMCHRTIGYYAEKMNITPRYLHKVCKQSMGQKPKEVIDYIIVGKAKKLLLTTGMTNQEIADRLLFPDQTTFGQYFKRNIGMSPTEFRNRYK